MRPESLAEPGATRAAALTQLTVRVSAGGVEVPKQVLENPCESR